LTTPTIDDLGASEVFTPEPPQHENGDKPELKFLDADIADFIKRPKSGVAREYEKKTASALNSCMRLLVQNPKTVADGAAIIAYGDDFAAAVGEVAEVNKRTRQMIDLVLSPESPWMTLAIAGIPLATQLIRNHQASVADAVHNRPGKDARKAARAEAKANRPKVTFKLFKREFKVTIPIRFKLGFLMSQAVEPAALSDAVFSNPDVAKALKKRGIKVAEH
jgi:hypothetical protein